MLNLALAAPLMLLAACTYNLEELRTTTPTGDAFTQALSREYLDFANFEADKMYDWIDQDHFAAKGLQAARGEVVLPEKVEDWGVPEDKVAEISAARARLMTALDGGGRTVAPDRAAVAQARFDCWVEQWEEGWQFDHIAACRDQFFAALGDLETALKPKMMPAPQPAPVAAAPAVSLVFFDFDSAVLTPEARAIVRNAAQQARRGGTARLEVTGLRPARLPTMSACRNAVRTPSAIC
jgi:OOP family OmpA-OmpF porin